MGNERMESLDAFKATIIDANGGRVEYLPCAYLVSQGEYYLVMRAVKDDLAIHERELLLLRASQQQGDRQTFEVVEDISAFEPAIRRGLGMDERLLN